MSLSIQEVASRVNSFAVCLKTPESAFQNVFEVKEKGS